MLPKRKITCYRIDIFTRAMYNLTAFSFAKLLAGNTDAVIFNFL